MTEGDRFSALPVCVLIGLFLVCATLWSLMVPPFETPDETGHARYVNFLAAERRLPVAGAEARGEAHQPPLYYIIVAAAGELLRLTPIPLEPARNASFLWYGGTDENKYQHGADELPPLSGSLRGLHGLRLISILLGASTVLLIHRLASSMLTPAEALLAAALAAFLPQFTFIAASLNNDNLANALCAAAILLLVLAVESPRTILWVGAGALTGVAMTAKFTSLVLVPCALLSIFMASRASRLGRGAGFSASRAGIQFLAPAIAIASPLLIRNAVTMGDPLGMTAQIATLPQLLDRKGPLSAYFILEFPVVLFESFWGRFGWMSLRLPDAIYLALVLPAAAAVIGLLLAARQMSRRHLLLAAIVALQLGQIVAFNLTFTQAQGRFLFPALGPIVVLMCAGWMALGSHYRMPAPGPGAALIAVSLMALGNLAVLLRFVAPAY